MLRLYANEVIYFNIFCKKRQLYVAQNWARFYQGRRHITIERLSWGYVYVRYLRVK